MSYAGMTFMGFLVVLLACRTAPPPKTNGPTSLRQRGHPGVHGYLSLSRADVLPAAWVPDLYRSMTLGQQGNG
jgi:hypothetical protein